MPGLIQQRDVQDLPGSANEDAWRAQRHESALRDSGKKIGLAQACQIAKYHVLSHEWTGMRYVPQKKIAIS